MDYHNPVLLKEAVEALQIESQGKYADVTFGGGGHSREILKELTEGILFAFDQDPDAHINAPQSANFILIKQNFRHLKRYLKFYKAIPINGLLADLGISSYQIDKPERGFSTRFDASLDMRMDKTSPLTAKKIINNYSQDQLQQLFSELGEVRNSKTLAIAIINGRKEKSIDTINQFKELLKPIAPRGKENQYYAQVFQALRIEVNDELNALKELLVQSTEVMKKGGRLVVISYHSLEDRLVKNFINKGKFEGEPDKDFYGNVQGIQYKAITKKPVVPSEEEISRNPRSRSARMRIAEKI
ncbi:MAG: 16S rRNA (cytosine(1402)-N(4))-methyltransferase RsmH [Bacteroidia bacterium]